MLSLIIINSWGWVKAGINNEIRAVSTLVILFSLLISSLNYVFRSCWSPKHLIFSYLCRNTTLVFNSRKCSTSHRFWKEYLTIIMVLNIPPSDRCFCNSGVQWKTLDPKVFILYTLIFHIHQFIAKMVLDREMSRMQMIQSFLQSKKTPTKTSSKGEKTIKTIFRLR